MYKYLLVIRYIKCFSRDVLILLTRIDSLRGRRKNGRGGGGGGGRKARKRGKVTLSPQSPSFLPFLPIPYPFRRLLRRLTRNLILDNGICHLWTSLPALGY